MCMWRTAFLFGIQTEIDIFLFFFAYADLCAAIQTITVTHSIKHSMIAPYDVRIFSRKTGNGRKGDAVIFDKRKKYTERPIGRERERETRPPLVQWNGIGKTTLIHFHYRTNRMWNVKQIRIFRMSICQLLHFCISGCQFINTSYCCRHYKKTFFQFWSKVFSQSLFSSSTFFYIFLYYITTKYLERNIHKMDYFKSWLYILFKCMYFIASF